MNNKQIQQGLIPVLSVTPKNQINVAPDLNDSSFEPQLEQLSVIPKSTLKQNTSGMDLDDTEEGEQSIFYSPDLFEGDAEEKEESTEVERSPAEVSHPGNSTARILLEDLFGLEQGKRTLSEDVVSSTVPDNTLLKGSAEQTELYCTTDFDVPASQNGASSSRSRRLSRSRQKMPSTSAASGKLTNYFKFVPPTSQPCIITIDD